MKEAVILFAIIFAAAIVVVFLVPPSGKLALSDT